jgi:TonB-linked SusC/RagA family outer membrane protein
VKRHLFGWVLIAALVALPAALSAQQQQTITGRVTNADTGEPLPSVRVTVKGTVIGTLTDNEGRFSIIVPGDATTLVFSSLGVRRREAPIEPTMSVTLERVALELEGVVVTALGIEREKPTLGYSVQDVTGEQASEVPELNIVNSLQGRVAGVQITDAGPTGGSSRIVIRGASSITGNNQPLFVVDGVPVDNSAPRNAGFGGIDYGNTIQDIDPNNIESISVLKGPNAAALYGSRAANGAIVITTKSGATGAAVSLSTSVLADQPLRLPNYQNLYGQGVNGEFQWVDGAGAGTWDFVDESWGPKMDGRLIDQFTGPQQPWVPHPDNVRNFFETGTQWSTNLAVSQAGENANVRLSVTNTRVAGMMPGLAIDRLSVALKGGAAISERLWTEASLNYLNQDADNRPGTGYDEDNPLQSFIWFGRQVDMNALKNYTCAGDEVTPCTEGGQYNWNYNYHNNPYWEQLVNINRDSRNRLLGHVQASYRLGDWVTVTGRVGRDWYRDFRKRVTAFHSLDDAGDGGFFQEEIYNSETNFDLIVAATRQLSSDLTLNLTGVGNLRQNAYQVSDVSVTGLTAPGIYTIDNAAVTPNPSDYESEKEVRSLRGALNLNYKGWLNLDLTGSNDWSSTLPEGSNSYFYPAVSTALLFSDALNLGGSVMSSGKIRASWSRVGNDTDPYQLTSVFSSQQAFGAVPMFAVPNQLPNVDLKPEETQAWEIGGDLGFLDERLGFVLTYYDRTTENQILGVQISSTSGYTSQVLNAGKVRNFGTELLLQANPVRAENFNWDLTLNWAKNNSQVRALYGDLETLVLQSYWSLDVEARGPRRDENGNVVEYYPYGTMFGNGYLTDDQGQWMLSASGLPRRDPVRRVLGSYTPDWTGGIQNRFSFGAFELSVSLDGQWGGDIFSTTKWFGEYAGVLESTLRGRENDFYYDPTIDPATGDPVGRVCDPGIVVSGVLPDGSINGDGVDDVTVCPDDYFHANFGNNEAGMVDATYLKLRELRLAAALPSSWVSKIGFSSGQVALIGRNLALWSKVENIDPETAFDASNVQGLEFGQYPTARSLGFSVTFRR